ncbi:MAG: tetratricopeptide repeat protein [Blastocatellia bacterium]
MRRCALILSLILLLSLSTFSSGDKLNSTVAAKETWTSVRSKNFFLVGDASEKSIRKVAVKLEQFREVFSRLFPKTNINSPIPIRVIVFKDRKSYQPFMPVYQGKISEVAGYFQSGSDVHYITLTAELSQENLFGAIFHEYVHSLTNDNVYRAPAWFNEGLAEFYSTFKVTDSDRKVWMGSPISRHILRLRENNFLPLPKLFAVEHDSPDYNEKEKKSVFYAQSWALVHYLLLGNNATRQPQFTQYLDLLSKGVSVDESFRQAFQTDYATMETELKNYISRNTYPANIFTFDQKLRFDATLETARISEAEWNYYLGDLMLHLRHADCEQYLKKAVQLDPNLAIAHAALGMARMKERRFAEARESLERAVVIETRNHLIHYYYAFVLSREAMDESNFVSGYEPEVTQKMREHLKKAIAIAPNFPESYNLLAFVNLVANEELDESDNLLRRAIALSPNRQDFAFALAQVQSRRRQYDEARKLVEGVITQAANPQLRQRAQTLLDSINAGVERLKAEAEAEAAKARESAQTDGKTNEDKSRITLRRNFDGERMQGLLTEVQCGEGEITIVVKDDARAFRFKSTTPERVFFITYTREVSRSITCGKVHPAKPVVVTYRSSTNARSRFDGEPVAVEFVKPDEK